ncbi:MAG: 1,4-dihydroxy-2-naphthoate polyprenyltransferase [Actinobacteria bacterium]|nr:1,4-dihydroxy-2-naphthoate polyprenyltransferase [Actinomycetota bacterium]
MNVWVEAARPRTLPAAVAPVLVGTAVADRVSAWRFVAALVVSLSLQVAVNFANDLYDGVRGVDTAARTGPRRVVAAGLVSPGRMKAALVVALAVAATAGLALTVAVGWELLLVGALAILAALGYSGGSSPYASRALGEVFVFVFFGLVATAGSQYVQDGELAWIAVGAAIPVGCITTAILVVNNLRDIPTDGPAGKRTLAVVLGDARTRQLFVALIAAAFAADVVLAVVLASPWPLLALVGIPLGGRAVGRVRRAARGRELVPVLELVGRLTLVHGVALALGLLITVRGR